MNKRLSWFGRNIFAGAAILLLSWAGSLQAAVWQWSEPVDGGRAFLWIPGDCKKVRAIVFGQDNMIEQGLLEHPAMRRTLAGLGIAELWVAPPYETWQNAATNDAANAKFDGILQAFARDSGYGELKSAPIIPLGHSAMASFPWNFAAWNPQRTLAILSVHGDAPQTNLTGNSKPNAEWGTHTIDGIPGLMVMGEYEWSEGRLTPALKFRAEHPDDPIAMLAEPGSGHFNYNDDLGEFLAMFIQKAVAARLPAQEPAGQGPALKPVQAKDGWLVQRWTLNQPRTIRPAPFAQYKGDSSEAFWAFDQEMAQAVHGFRANQIGKLPQLLSVTADDQPVEKGCGEPVTPPFIPEADGITFHLKTAFMDHVPAARDNGNPARWSELPGGSSIGHASGGGPIVMKKIVGPVAILSPDTFQIQLNLINGTDDRRKYDIWLFASHPGDAKYKSIIQQVFVRITPNTEGIEQHLTFPTISPQRADAAPIKLEATSDAGLPVAYYVQQGPAKVVDGKLKLLPIPPRAKYPVKVTVVAWQWGRSNGAKVKTATPVEQTFDLTGP